MTSSGIKIDSVEIFDPSRSWVGTLKITYFGHVLTPLFEGLVKTVTNGGDPSWNGAIWPIIPMSPTPSWHNPSGPLKRGSKKGPKMVDFRGSQVDPRSTPWVEVDPPPENDLPIYILSRARGVGVGGGKSTVFGRVLTHF